MAPHSSPPSVPTFLLSSHLNARHANVSTIRSFVRSFVRSFIRPSVRRHDTRANFLILINQMLVIDNRSLDYSRSSSCAKETASSCLAPRRFRQGASSRSRTRRLHRAGKTKILSPAILKSSCTIQVHIYRNNSVGYGAALIRPPLDVGPFKALLNQFYQFCCPGAYV